MPDLLWPVVASKGNLQRFGGGTDESGSDICFGCCPILAAIGVLCPFISHELDPKTNTAGGFMAATGWRFFFGHTAGTNSICWATHHFSACPLPPWQVYCQTMFGRWYFQSYKKCMLEISAPLEAICPKTWELHSDKQLPKRPSGRLEPCTLNFISSHVI